MANSINYLLIHPFFYPHKGGSEKYAEELLVALKANHPEIHVDVLCYNSDGANAYDEYRGFRVYRVPCFTIIKDRFLLPNPFKLWAVLSKLSANKYAFVHTHVRFFDPCWWGWIYAKSIGAKSIHTDHVASHPAYQNRFVELIGIIVDLTIAKHSMERYDFLTAANKMTKDFMSKGLGVKKPVTVVHIGVDTDEYKEGLKSNRTVPKLKTSIKDEEVLITFVGRMLWTKGVDMLYEVFKNISSVHPNTKLVLAGSGELFDKLRLQIQSDGLSDKALLLGQLEYNQVKELLSISDIFVNPSHHNEGLPNTLLEAASSGCAVIATDNGSSKDIIRNGETGLLIPQKDAHALETALLDLLENKAKREALASEAKKLVIQNYGWKSISEEFYKLISSQG